MRLVRRGLCLCGWFLPGVGFLGFKDEPGDLDGWHYAGRFHGCGCWVSRLVRGLGGVFGDLGMGSCRRLCSCHCLGPHGRLSRLPRSTDSPAENRDGGGSYYCKRDDEDCCDEREDAVDVGQEVAVVLGFLVDPACEEEDD